MSKKKLNEGIVYTSVGEWRNFILDRMNVFKRVGEF